MRRLQTPFNIMLLDTRGIENRVPAVKSMDVFVGASKNYHPEGLFSNEIFGQQGAKRRMSSMSYINVKLTLIHPIIFNIITKAKAFYKDIISGKIYATFDKASGTFNKSNAIEGATGFDFFMKHLAELRLPESDSYTRKDGIAVMEKYRDLLITDKVVVIPAGLRDYVIEDGKESSDDINKLYYKLLAVSNTINPSTAKIAPATYNAQRLSLQKTFNELYTYITNILRNKRGFVAKRWLARSVHYGTRNVITSNIEHIYSLNAKYKPGFDDCLVGIYQFCKGVLPVTTHQLRSRFLEKVFPSQMMPALLTDPKTLMATEVKVSSSTYAHFMSNEGIEKLTNVLEEETLRHNPVMVEGKYYLGLCYKDGKGNFAFINGVDEIPFEYTPDQVKPITYAELVYYALYPVASKYHVFVTRYPVTGVGSAYPARVFLKTTTNYITLQELDPGSWKPIEGSIAPQWPVLGAAFFNSCSLHNSKLGALGADFDGDKCSFNFVMSNESLAEIEAYYKDRNSQIGTDGKFINSLKTDTFDFVVAHMCRGAAR